MKNYTVHEPPERWREARRGPERFAFVRDGFHFWAFVLGPIWMLWRRLFLVLLGYIVLVVVLDVALFLVHASNQAVFATHLLLAFLVGLEAASLRRWTLRRRGWRDAGVVVGDDQEAAERRFFDRWSAGPVADAVVPAAPATLPVMRRDPSSSEALGLFPEPGAPR
jgi:hypothetical protein